MNKHVFKIIAGLVMACFVQASFAGPIVSAVRGTIQLGGPGSGSIADTLNQNGLATSYTSGVTDFDAYLATEGGHSTGFAGLEWFSNQGTNAATVTYDLGSAMMIDALALWNEESSGIGTLQILGSTDNLTFNSLASGLSPTDWPGGSGPNYTADRFNFSATNLQYIRLVATNCPQQQGTYQACAIGEVAFRMAGGQGVPEPGTLSLFGLSALLLGMGRRRIAKK